ncbi:thioredoxin domain-containing protein, partial [Escherichia coli]|nr:thioredoxin domain-containing protein [Escherichia coli]
LLMVEKTLDSLASSGLYDQIGGGFARYSTDQQWMIPHFEKMLYDQGLLLHAYIEAYQMTKKQRYREIIEESITFLIREMRDSQTGAFYSA